MTAALLESKAAGGGWLEAAADAAACARSARQAWVTPTDRDRGAALGGDASGGGGARENTSGVGLRPFQE